MSLVCFFLLFLCGNGRIDCIPIRCFGHIPLTLIYAVGDSVNLCFDAFFLCSNLFLKFVKCLAREHVKQCSEIFVIRCNLIIGYIACHAEKHRSLHIGLLLIEISRTGDELKHLFRADIVYLLAPFLDRARHIIKKTLLCVACELRNSRASFLLPFLYQSAAKGDFLAVDQKNSGNLVRHILNHIAVCIYGLDAEIFPVIAVFPKEQPCESVEDCGFSRTIAPLNGRDMLVELNRKVLECLEIEQVHSLDNDMFHTD